MSNLVDPNKLDVKVIESIVTKGDLSALDQNQLVSYYNYRCSTVGLDPSAKPFDVLLLNGKKVLYANASATQQLSSVHGLSVTLTNRERVETIYIVSARVTGKDARYRYQEHTPKQPGPQGQSSHDLRYPIDQCKQCQDVDATTQYPLHRLYGQR